MLLLIFLVTMVTANNVINPKDTPPQIYRWIVPTQCLDQCEVHVRSQQNKPIKVVTNIDYFSSYFDDVYYWDTWCDPNTTCTITYQSDNFVTLYASTELKTGQVPGKRSTNRMYTQMIVPQCQQLTLGQCLIVNIATLTFYDDPDQFGLTDSLTSGIGSDVKWTHIRTKKTMASDKWHYLLTATIVVDCYLTEHNQLHQLALSNIYYFKNTGSTSDITYQIIDPHAMDEDVMRRERTYLSLFIIFCCLTVLLLIGLLLTIHHVKKHCIYQKMYVELEDEH